LQDRFPLLPAILSFLILWANCAYRVMAIQLPQLTVPAGRCLSDLMKTIVRFVPGRTVLHCQILWLDRSG
jgi:hypothetical protein